MICFHTNGAGYCSLSWNQAQRRIEDDSIASSDQGADSSEGAPALDSQSPDESNTSLSSDSSEIVGGEVERSLPTIENMQVKDVSRSGRYERVRIRCPISSRCAKFRNTGTAQISRHRCSYSFLTTKNVLKQKHFSKTNNKTHFFKTEKYS